MLEVGPFCFGGGFFICQVLSCCYECEMKSVAGRSIEFAES